MSGKLDDLLPYDICLDLLSNESDDYDDEYDTWYLIFSSYSTIQNSKFIPRFFNNHTINEASWNDSVLNMHNNLPVWTPHHSSNNLKFFEIWSRFPS